MVTRSMSRGSVEIGWARSTGKTISAWGVVAPSMGCVVWNSEKCRSVNQCLIVVYDVSDSLGVASASVPRSAVGGVPRAEFPRSTVVGPQRTPAGSLRTTTLATSNSSSSMNATRPFGPNASGISVAAVA